MIVETVHVLYPDDYYVTAEHIIGWAHDALVNAAVDDYVKVHGPIPDGPDGEACWAILAQGQQRPDLEGAKEILSDLGLATFAREDIAVRHRITVNRMQDTPLRRLARKCWPKEQHETKGAAEAQMRSLTRRGLEKDATLVHVYKCPYCSLWHVGHGLGGDR
jgi:hypothetical protein